MALHDSQRQPDAVSAASDQTATAPPAVHPHHPAQPNSSTQQEATHAEQSLTSQQQGQQSKDQQVQHPGSSQSAQHVTVPQEPQEVEAQAADDAHSSQQQVPGQEQLARSGIGTPTGTTTLPDSMTKHDPQQQLLQQLAAQAGFQLVSPPPGQPAVPAGSAQTAMHQAEQGTPLLATLPHQQQQQWAALSHAGVSNHDLSHELSHGLLQQLGQGLQSSAMQVAAMQQQQQVQQQSRLPAWAQQALLPDQAPPVTPPAAYYGMPGLSPAHSMHALPSPPAQSMPGQYVSSGQMHEQYDPAGMRASLGGSSSWHLPAWQQQQQQAQATPQWLLDQHAQQYGSMAAAESLHHRAVQGDGPYHTPHRSSPLDPRSSQAAASWPFSQGGPAMGTPADPQGRHSPPLLPPQAGTADALQSHGSASRQQHSSRGEDSLPAMLQDSYADTVAAAKLSLQDSGPEMGVPPVLSGGSSGVSSPLRGSGHLESLMEVNNRVEAAMGRARAQLQVRSHHCFCHVMCMMAVRASGLLGASCA